MAEEMETVDPQERFLEFFKKEKYRQRIEQMAITGKESITVDFEELYTFDQQLGERLLEKPDDYMKYANNAAYAQLGIEDSAYAEKTEGKITVRIIRLFTREQLRKLGSKNIGKLLLIEAIVVRATPVRPMVMMGSFKCKRCGTISKVDQTGPFLKAPFECTDPSCRQKGPFEFVQDESSFVDSQDLRLQEKPEDLPPGQLPRTLNVKLVGTEIVDVARPGDHVSIVGVVRAFAPSRPGIGKLRTFILQVDANSIEVLGKEPETSPPSPEEEEKILELAKDPLVHKKIVNSIAPSIFGYERIKEAIMYLLFGGVSKSLPDITIRGEMNALLIGDPGTAKSQLLQYVARIAPRGLYTSGRGTTAAGLTAAVIREKGGSMSLEAGALVLADKGIACLHPSSNVILDGRVVEIGKIVDDQNFAFVFANGELNQIAALKGNTVSVNLETGQTVEGKVTKLRRKWFKGKIIKIQLRSGHVTRVTPNHLFIDGSTLKWKKASHFETHEYVVAPIGKNTSQTSIYAKKVTSKNSFRRAAMPLHECRCSQNMAQIAMDQEILVTQNSGCISHIKTRIETVEDKKLAQVEYSLDEIVSVSEEAYEGYVYDLMMQSIHNYLSDGVISHNCIDEMDKMRPEDRVAIHEAMEQHTVSVAKGGIVATLNARTAILAAANPTLGRYEPHRTVAENISLPVTILSRFDLIFVLRDVPDKDADTKMSEHILEIHRRGVSPVEAPISAELMRKYVSYAKAFKPVLSNDAIRRLSDFYLAMRSASETEGSPVAITARQLESLVRISEARARVALRKEVTAEDAEAGIALMKMSLEQVGIDMSSYKMDIDLIMTGRPKSVRDKLHVVLSVLIQMERETGIVEKSALMEELDAKHKIPKSETDRMIGQLLREGTIYEPKEGHLKKT
jgi:DNA replicative helicase MCM subunit Mcm2 (Cdc46/Mcm family)